MASRRRRTTSLETLTNQSETSLAEYTEVIVAEATPEPIIPEEPKEEETREETPKDTVKEILTSAVEEKTTVPPKKVELIRPRRNISRFSR